MSYEDSEVWERLLVTYQTCLADILKYVDRSIAGQQSGSCNEFGPLLVLEQVHCIISEPGSAKLAASL